MVISDGHLPAALALVRELGKAGHDIRVVCEGSHAPLALRSKYVTGAIHLAPSLTKPNVREALLNILHDSEEKPVFIPLCRETIKLVVDRRAHFDAECYTLAPRIESLQTANDKRKLYKLAESLGIEVPAERHFLDFEKISDFARRQPKPVVLKYYDGENLFLPPYRRYTVARTSRELYTRYSTMYDVQSPVLVQDFVAGDCYGVGLVLNRASQPVSVFCHQRIRQHPYTGGNGTLVRSVWEPAMAACAAALTAALGLVGFAYVEFRGNSQRFTLMDVSARAWHSLALGHLCHLNLGTAYAAAACGEPLDTNLLMRYDPHQEMQFFLEDLSAAWQGLWAGHPETLWQALRDGVRPSVRSGLYDKEDPAPVKSYLASIIAQTRRKVKYN